MNQNKKKVLVAPLNWGLGHATRCVPVIRELIKQGAEVILASDGAALTLLKQEFPHLTSIELPGYDIRYTSGNFMPLQMLLQAPGIFSTIRKEHKALNRIVNNHKIDIIISDNRYGLYHDEKTSVFITHQINIRPTKGLELAGWLINKINIHYIQKFHGCWVPDEKDDNNLSGELSHGDFPIVPLKYIGPLSRFSSSSESDEKEYKYDLAIILSGPEPQRTLFEDIINKQLGTIRAKILMVRGTELENPEVKTSGTITIVNHLSAFELEKAMNSSSLVLCRSGYSSIMDLALLGKNAILVPTPGQTEQEYLADYFYKKGVFYCVSQDDLNIRDAISKCMEFKGIKFPQNNYLRNAIQILLENELV